MSWKVFYMPRERERERESTGGGTKIGEKEGFFFKITSIFKQFC